MNLSILFQNSGIVFQMGEDVWTMPWILVGFVTYCLVVYVPGWYVTKFMDQKTDLADPEIVLCWVASPLFVPMFCVVEIAVTVVKFLAKLLRYKEPDDE